MLVIGDKKNWSWVFYCLFGFFFGGRLVGLGRLLLHGLEGGEDVGPGDDSDDLSVPGDDWEPVDLVLEHDGGGLSDGVGLLDGPGGGGHDLSHGASLLVQVLLGDDADADALAVDDRDAGDVVEELLHGLHGAGGVGGQDVGGHDAGDGVALLLLEDLAGVVLADVLVTRETPVRWPLAGGNHVLVDRVGDVRLGAGQETLEPEPVGFRWPRGAGDGNSGATGGGDLGSRGDSGVHVLGVWSWFPFFRCVGFRPM